MTFVNVITQFSTVDFWYMTCILHCVPLKVKSPSITIYLTPLTLYYSPVFFPLVITILLSVSVSFCFITTYEWNHMVLCFIAVISLSIIFSRPIHVVAKDSFLWLSNIHLIHVLQLLYPIIYRRMVVLIVFYVLATVHNVAMNIGVHISFKSMFSSVLARHPERRLLGHMKLYS